MRITFSYIKNRIRNRYYKKLMKLKFMFDILTVAKILVVKVFKINSSNSSSSFMNHMSFFSVTRVRSFQIILFITSLATASSTLLAGDQLSNKELNQLLNKDKHRWLLVWSDEFEGEQVDNNKWNVKQNCHIDARDSNNCHQGASNNVSVNNGILTMKAPKKAFEINEQAALNTNEKQHQQQAFATARLSTKGKGDWQYGRFEIRAKLPAGQGLWPSVLMKPTDNIYGNLSASGGIDIVEAVNLRTQTDQKNIKKHIPETRVYGTVHYGKSWPNTRATSESYSFPVDQDAVSQFHTYSIEWNSHGMQWYIDDKLFASKTPETWSLTWQRDIASKLELQHPEAAPFNQAFHLILNLAIGGKWAEGANEMGVKAPASPAKMEIDYVRVYECRSALDMTHCDNLTPTIELGSRMASLSSYR